MTKEQQEACEALADKYCEIYRFASREQKQKMFFHYKDGFKAAQTPEMLMLNPLVKGLVEALDNINKHDACVALTQGRYEKFNNYEEAWYGVADYAGKALAPFKEVDRGN